MLSSLLKRSLKQAFYCKTLEIEDQYVTARHGPGGTPDRHDAAPYMDAKRSGGVGSRCVL